MPSTRLASSTRISASTRFPPENASIIAENFNPSPVSPTTPTMIPATAQAIDTATALRAPSSSPASRISHPERSAADRRAPVTGTPARGSRTSISTARRNTATPSISAMA